MKPRLLAETNCACCVDTEAPSELLTSGLASNAACSQRRAVSIASSTVNAQGWYKSRSGQLLRHQRRIGQAGAVVFGGEAGDVERRLDRLAQRLRREIGGAGVALALADVDGDADALVAVELDGFDFVATHADRLAEAFGDIDLAGRRALVAGMLQDILGQLLQRGEGIGKAGDFGHRTAASGRESRYHSSPSRPTLAMHDEDFTDRRRPAFQDPDASRRCTNCRISAPTWSSCPPAS